MKTLIILGLVVCLTVQTGESLKCYICVNKDCITMDCDATYQCATLVNGTQVSKTCVDPRVCDTIIDGMKTTCCASDLCNSAVSAKMSFATIAVSLVVVWMTKQCIA